MSARDANAAPTTLRWALGMALCVRLLRIYSLYDRERIAEANMRISGRDDGWKEGEVGGGVRVFHDEQLF